MDQLSTPKISSKDADNLMAPMVLDLTAVFQVYQDLILQELSRSEGKEKPDVVIQRVLNLIEEGEIE